MLCGGDRGGEDLRCRQVGRPLKVSVRKPEVFFELRAGSVDGVEQAFALKLTLGNEVTGFGLAEPDSQEGRSALGRPNASGQHALGVRLPSPLSLQAQWNGQTIVVPASSQFFVEAHRGKDTDERVLLKVGTERGRSGTEQGCVGSGPSASSK